MFGLDAFHLARVQFAFTVSFHIIFPAITIGLASYLAVLEGLWLKTKNPVWRSLYHFWSKIFAVNFGMGVVSGLVMAYQFGTNWSGFSQFAGSITGPLLTYEVLTAFFLEAGFLGVMLFGWNRVGPGLHFFATCMVALGTIISTFWILASNSWMQTPQGFEIVDGQVVPVDWLAVIFNPSFPYRLLHMTVAAFLSSALFVGASAAWHLLRGNQSPAIRKMFSMALWMTLLVAPVQALIGDMHGLNTLQHQPARIAIRPDGPIHRAKRRNGREWYSRSPRRSHRASTPSSSINMPSPAIRRNDQNTTVEFGRSSGANSFNAGTCLSRLWVRIRLPRAGISSP